MPLETNVVKDYYDAYWNQASPPPDSDPFSTVRHELFWKFSGGIARPFDLLECGSGRGHFVAGARSQGIHANGMEVSGVAIERARAQYPDCEFMQHSVEDLPWPVPSESYDVVAAFEVIEHLLRPSALLAGARASLRPGGALAITTPYHGLIKNLAVVLGAFDRHFNPAGDHIRFFSDQALRNMCEREGFVVQRIVHFGRHWPLSAGTFMWSVKG